MHSFEHSTKTTQPVVTTFNYRSDLSGFVKVAVDNHKHVDSINIPGEALVAFAVHHFRRELISKLENMTTDELVKQLLK